jgi:nucleotide-binding universal stress UspA family protein
LFVAAPISGRVELEGTGEGYLEEHRVSHKRVKYDCGKCEVEGAASGPVGDILHLVDQEQIDLVVMGGTRRGYRGRVLWPEMAYGAAGNIKVPLLIWY